MCILLRRLELGLITVEPAKEGGRVEVHLHPQAFDRARSLRANRRKRYSIIKETAGRSGHYNTGGASRTRLITAYREQAIHIACCMMKYGDMSPAQLRKMGTGPKTSDILRDNYYGWFTRVTRGIYRLEDTAREFLKEYPELVGHYMKKIAEAEQERSAGQA